VRHVHKERLTIGQTATGYWVVKRGSVHLAGALTRKSAEAERELLERLRDRGRQRAPAFRRGMRAREQLASSREEA
jgi:hypothetical protein